MVGLPVGTSLLHLFLHLKHSYYSVLLVLGGECRGMQWAGIKINFRSFFEATRNLILSN